MVAMFLLLSACSEVEPEPVASSLGAVVAECDRSADEWVVVTGADVGPSDALELYWESDTDSALFDVAAGLSVFSAPCDARVTVRLWEVQETGASVLDCATSTEGGAAAWDCSSFWVRECDQERGGEQGDEYPDCAFLLP